MIPNEIIHLRYRWPLKWIKYNFIFRKLYVAVAIVLCLLTAGLLLFFLLPRSVELKSFMPSLTPKHMYINVSQSFVSLTIEVCFHTSNTKIICLATLSMFCSRWVQKVITFKTLDYDSSNIWKATLYIAMCQGGRVSSKPPHEGPQLLRTLADKWKSVLPV